MHQKRADRVTPAWRARIRVPSLPIALVAALLVGLLASTAGAVDLDQKYAWQARYRDLRMQAARLEVTIDLATKEYADANRRNYRRSGVRHFHRTNANEAKAELARVREKIASLRDEARTAGVPMSWLYEVEDEKIDLDRVQGLGDYANEGRFGGKGAYAPETTDEDASALQDDGGRNPLYIEEPEPPAGLDDSKEKPFEYGDWLEDRGEYEQDRAKEKHLVPGQN